MNKETEKTGSRKESGRKRRGSHPAVRQAWRLAARGTAGQASAAGGLSGLAAGGLLPAVLILLTGMLLFSMVICGMPSGGFFLDNFSAEYTDYEDTEGTGWFVRIADFAETAADAELDYMSDTAAGQSMLKPFVLAKNFFRYAAAALRAEMEGLDESGDDALTVAAEAILEGDACILSDTDKFREDLQKKVEVTVRRVKKRAELLHAYLTESIPDSALYGSSLNGEAEEQLIETVLSEYPDRNWVEGESRITKIVKGVPACTEGTALRFFCAYCAEGMNESRFSLVGTYFDWLGIKGSGAANAPWTGSFLPQALYDEMNLRIKEVYNRTGWSASRRRSEARRIEEEYDCCRTALLNYYVVVDTSVTVTDRDVYTSRAVLDYDPESDSYQWRYESELDHVASDAAVTYEVKILEPGNIGKLIGFWPGGNADETAHAEELEALGIDWEAPAGNLEYSVGVYGSDGCSGSGTGPESLTGCVLIGDSRTDGMCHARNPGAPWSGTTSPAKEYTDPEGNYWVYKVGASAADFSVMASMADSHISAGTAVFILMGVNDAAGGESAAADYRRKINALAADWETRGAAVTYVNAGPVDDRKAQLQNRQIEIFNSAMSSGGLNVPVLDQYGFLKNRTLSFSADGLHYSAADYLQIYDWLMEKAFSGSGEEDTAGISRIIFTGDSRTVILHNAVYPDSAWTGQPDRPDLQGDEVWLAVGGSTLDSSVDPQGRNLQNFIMPNVEEYIGEGTAVLVMHGFNSAYDTMLASEAPKYIEYINRKAEEYALRGAHVYFITAGPPEGSISGWGGCTATAETVEAFNRLVTAGLSSRVGVIDLCSWLQTAGYSTSDGVHYDGETSLRIYEFIRQQLLQGGSGMSGSPTSGSGFDEREFSADTAFDIEAFLEEYGGFYCDAFGFDSGMLENMKTVMKQGRDTSHRCRFSYDPLVLTEDGESGETVCRQSFHQMQYYRDLVILTAEYGDISPVMTPAASEGSGRSAADDIVAAARRELAEQEASGGSGGEKYCTAAGLDADASWCSAFVYYCADLCGLAGEGSVFGPCTGVCTTALSQLSSAGAVLYYPGSDSYMPRRGDIVFWWNGGRAGETADGIPDGLSHMGIVTEDGFPLRTIEGNCSDRIKENQWGEDLTLPAWGSSWLFAAARPDYPVYDSGGSASKDEVHRALCRALYQSDSGCVSCGFDGYVHLAGRHEGIDCCLAFGAPLYCVADAEVISVLPSYVCTYDAANDMTVIYMHLKQNSLAAGQMLRRGDLVGWEDSISAEAVHTHMEVRTGRCTGAARSLNDAILDNPDPYAYWTKVLGLVPASGSLTGSSNEEKTWNYLLARGYSKAGAAGIMGNFYYESGFHPENLENGANTKSGLSDAQFAAAVDNGSISRAEFISSSRFGLYSGGLYGFGLGQFTAAFHKENLYDLAKSRGVSIADLQTQIDWVIQDLGARLPGLDNYLRTTDDPWEAARRFEARWEVSAGGLALRGQKAQEYYGRYA